MNWSTILFFPLLLLVVGSAVSQSNRRKSDLSPDRNDEEDVLVVSKKAWKDIHPVWGKRCWDCIEDNLDKRGWERLQTGWGKRGRAESPLTVGLWTEPKSPDWQRFRGTWGKKSDGSSWRNLKGTWGKRSLENEESTEKP